MRLTIIVSDKAVYIDGVCHLDLIWDGTPENAHALQWFEDKGWIEFNDDDPYDNIKPPNEKITALPDWALNAVEAWNQANLNPTIPTIEENVDTQNNPPPEALIDATQVVY